MRGDGNEWGWDSEVWKGSWGSEMVRGGCEKWMQ